MKTFATTTDLKQRMNRELSEDERSLAAILLQDATVYLIMEYKRCRKHIPTDEAGKAALKSVTCNMVKRILVSPTANNLLGSDIKSMRTDVGPFSETYEFANPDASIYLRSAERKMLNLNKKSNLQAIRLDEND